MRHGPQRRLVVVALAAATSLLVLAVPAAAHRHGGRGHARAAHVVVVGPGDSIQQAVDAAAAGSIIVVRPGTYAENVVITKDGITLAGHGAKLVPPANPGPPTPCSFGQPASDGICVSGQVSFPQQGPPTVTTLVHDVTIRGFDVAGFSGTGIVFFGAQNPVVKDDVAEGDGGYGIARFVSSGGAIVGNDASGAGEAGIYVGDSPNANVLIAGNRSHDNQLFGFFLRDSANGRVVHNESSGNCVGAIVLNTGANVAGRYRFFGNRIHDNDRLCPADPEEGSPPLSGIGVAIANASGNVLIGNQIRDNVKSGDVPFSGGVVVVDAGTPGANPPADNVVKGNVVLGNQPDLFWDGSGTGNVLQPNDCRTSVPDGLCAPPPPPPPPHRHGHGHRHHHHKHHHHKHHHHKHHHHRHH